MNLARFFHVFKHDFRLLLRNQIISISVIVSVLYIAVFQLLNTSLNTEKVLILLIFNDPALLGFLFIGVLVLFEKNESTLLALSVSPISIHLYMISKVTSLSLIALGCCYAMLFACNSSGINVFHFTTATLFTSAIFSFLGFLTVSGEQVFNDYLIKAVGVIVFLSIPFLDFFEVVTSPFFKLHPTQAVLALYSFTFSNSFSLLDYLFGYGASLFWLLTSYYFAFKRFKRDFHGQI